MSHFFSRKSLQVAVSILVLATLVLSAVPSASAQAAQTAPASVMATVDKGWTKFSWSPSARGPLAFNVMLTSINADLLTLPSLLTFTATAKVACPASGNAVVNVKVYDFNQLIWSMPYPVSCTYNPAAADPTVVRTANNYLNDTHYLHISIPIATGGAHNLVVVTDLATTDSLFWGYLRVDSAPGVPPKSDSNVGAIAVTAANAPATAWASVQWGDPTGTTWTTIGSWSGTLVQTNGRMALWVDAANFGTGPYRWVIYDRDPALGGKLWGVSDPFYFPRQGGDWLWTKVAPLSTAIR
jgi:hypothetical protein